MKKLSELISYITIDKEVSKRGDEEVEVSKRGDEEVEN